LMGHSDNLTILYRFRRVNSQQCIKNWARPIKFDIGDKISLKLEGFVVQKKCWFWINLYQFARYSINEYVQFMCVKTKFDNFW